MNLISSQSLVGKRVVGGKDGTQRIGKVRCCIFHPREKRCAGFLVKRPDVALMFHRHDLFVPLDGYAVEDGHVVLPAGDDATGRAAARKCGIDPDACVVWSGLPAMVSAEEKLGYVGSVAFDAETGEVESIVVSGGAASGAMLGTMRVPASLVVGFRTGIGEPLIASGAYDEDDDSIDPRMLGAIVLKPEARDIEAHGGVAEQAGRATAVAADKAGHAVQAVGKAAGNAAQAAGVAAGRAAEAAKPKVDSAAKTAGEALQKGAFATGRQIARSKGMFSAFKEEFDKAVKGEGTDGRR